MRDVIESRVDQFQKSLLIDLWTSLNNSFIL